MFFNNWFVVPHWMAKRPDEVEAKIRTTYGGSSAAIAGFSLDKVSAIMTADSHGGKAFQWAANPDWTALLQPKLARDELFLHLETYPGNESSYQLQAPLDQVLTASRNGWDMPLFKHASDAAALQQAAYDLNNGHYTEHQGDQMIMCMRQFAQVGYLAQELHAVLVAGRQTFMTSYSAWAIQAVGNTLFGPSTAFKDAVNAWFLAFNKKDLRLETRVHQTFAASINNKIQVYPGRLHMITAGDAHIEAGPDLAKAGGKPFHELIQLPRGQFGLVDAKTH